ncbi:MAG: hypothetical protein MOP51_677 [Citricoccus sp.]|nr:hypothetical protein [Citricoccus sp. WCRC_4]
MVPVGVMAEVEASARLVLGGPELAEVSLSCVAVGLDDVPVETSAGGDLVAVVYGPLTDRGGLLARGRRGDGATGRALPRYAFICLRSSVALAADRSIS